MEQLKEMIRRLDRIATMLYQNDSKSLQTLGAEFQGISNGLLQICRVAQPQVAQELVSALKRLMDAFAQKNVITLADIIRYEIENKLIAITQNATSMNNIDIEINETESSQGESSQVGYSHAESSKVGSSHAESLQAESSQAGSSQSEILQTGASDTECLDVTLKEQYPFNMEHLILNEEYYRGNLDALEEAQGGEIRRIAENYCNAYATEEDDTILMDGNCNIAVHRGDCWCRLNSQYDPEKAAKVWTESMRDIYYKSILVVCGISNVEYIRQTLATLGRENLLIVYEPDTNIFALNMLYNRMDDILRDQRCFLFVDDINMDIFVDAFDRLVGYTAMELVKLYALPVYDVLYADKIKAFVTICRKQLDYTALVAQTIVMKNENVISNIIRNLQIVENSSSLLQLKGRFDENERKHIPAIIVAAGPSLDKNIDQLKQAKGKALIIGVDSSMRMLLKHEIMPDLVVTIDPDKERVLFEDERTDTVSIVYCMHSTFDILKKNKSRHILYSNTKYISRLFQAFDKKLGEIDSGGSVANAAFAVASYIGFKNIIMIGQDLAFTNNKKHASVVYAEKGISEEEKDQYEMIEGIDGKPILTYANFRVYRDWYETKIAQNQQIHVINATEGGAMIHGAVNMTLKDAIAQYCDGFGQIDFAEKITGCELILEDTQKKEFRKIIADTLPVCDRLKTDFERGKTWYQAIIDGVDARTLTDAQLKEYLDKTNAIIEDSDKESVMEFVSYYARQEELKASEGLFSSEDDRKDVAMRGIRVLDSYISAVEKVREKYRMLVEEMEI